MGVVWTAVDKIHKKQRFFYWAEWGEERTAGILQMTFLKKEFIRKDSKQ